VAEAVVLLARRNQVGARSYHQLAAEDAKVLGLPAMDYARHLLRERVAGWLQEQVLRGLHPSQSQPGGPFPNPAGRRRREGGGYLGWSVRDGREDDCPGGSGGLPMPPVVAAGLHQPS
jgi:hypothetical protein